MPGDVWGQFLIRKCLASGAARAAIAGTGGTTDGRRDVVVAALAGRGYVVQAVHDAPAAALAIE